MCSEIINLFIVVFAETIVVFVEEKINITFGTVYSWISLTIGVFATQGSPYQRPMILPIPANFFWWGNCYSTSFFLAWTSFSRRLELGRPLFSFAAPMLQRTKASSFLKVPKLRISFLGTFLAFFYILSMDLSLPGLKDDKKYEYTIFLTWSLFCTFPENCP